METSGRAIVYRECAGDAVASDTDQRNAVQAEVV